MTRILVLCLVLASPLLAADQAVVKRAKDLLYTDRQQSIAILEDAVQASPNDVEYWVELIHALDVDSADDFADRASRQALKLHPNHPDLLIARARILGGGAAMDLLAELAKIDRQKDTATMMIDYVSVTGAVPELPWTAGHYAVLFDRLTAQKRFERATQYLELGLDRFNDKDAKPLHGRAAILKALAGDINGALASHTAADDEQAILVDGYHGVADAFLDRDRPKLAITSYSRVPPAKDHFRYGEHVLAVAWARTGDLKRSLELLNGKDLSTRLLRYQVLVDAKQENEARGVADAIVAPYSKDWVGISQSGPWSRQLFWQPVSLRTEYRKAIKGLLERYPQHADRLKQELGTGDEQPEPGKYNGWSPLRSNSDRLAEYEKQLSTADAKQAVELRRQIGWLHASEGRYEPLLAVLPEAPAYEHWRWSYLRRRAMAINAADADYWKLAAVRRIIYDPRTHKQPKLTDEQVTQQLVAVGPDVLGDVMTALQPNTITGTNRSRYVHVVTALGSEQDAALLIEILRVASQSSGGRHPSLKADQNAADAATAAAIDAALAKLTRAKPEGADRLKAWTDWWAANAARIMASP